MEQRATFRDDAVDVLHGASGAPVWKGKIMDGDFFGGGGDGENGEVLDVFVKAWCGVRGDYKRLIWTKDTVSETCKDRVTSHPTFTKGPFCSAQRGMAKRTFCNGAFLGALDKISHEAGLSDVIPRAKYMRAKTFAPWDEGKETSSGVKQDMDVMVFGAAPGVGFESLGPRITPTLLELLRKIDPDRILKLALFDLLTSQGDRHGQNIFITEDGLIHGIDNESSMRNQLNSMLIPGGQKFETYRVGFIHTVCSLRNNCDTARPSPSTLGAMLDYRCYVDGGSIGKKYPKQFEEFLRKVDAMEDEEVYEYFGMAAPEFATKFKARVHDLLDLGFERTAKKLYAGMLPGDGRFGNFQYAIQPPCCGPSMCKLDTAGFSQEESQSCIHSCDVPIDPDFVGANTPNASNAAAAANVDDLGATDSAPRAPSPRLHHHHRRRPRPATPPSPCAQIQNRRPHEDARKAPTSRRHDRKIRSARLAVTQFPISLRARRPRPRADDVRRRSTDRRATSSGDARSRDQPSRAPSSVRRARCDARDFAAPRGDDVGIRTVDASSRAAGRARVGALARRRRRWGFRARRRFSTRRARARARAREADDDEREDDAWDDGAWDDDPDVDAKRKELLDRYVVVAAAGNLQRRGAARREREWNSTRTSRRRRIRAASDHRGGAEVVAAETAEVGGVRAERERGGGAGGDDCAGAGEF